MAESFNTLVLNRLAFGPRPDDQDSLKALGFNAWLTKQLNPTKGDNAAVATLLSQVRIPLMYTSPYTGEFIIENSPLTHLNKTTAQLWPLTDPARNPIDARRMRPLDEVRAAAFVRGVSSAFYLREVLVHFWHNHFSVNAAGDPRLSATFPVYDNIMRTYAFGNFRQMLEAVTKSTTMLVYLNNAYNHKNRPDENFARELLELHTMGIDAYLGRVTPAGNTSGYSDQDVVGVARALTGWTIASTDPGYYTTRNDGTFGFSWTVHDVKAKTALGLKFTGNEGINAGKAILDRLAAHPATARFLCTKLVRYFVSDNPPKALVDRAVTRWLAGVNSATQIRDVVDLIARSPEFAASAGQKTKDPFQYLVSFIRGTGIQWAPSMKLPEMLAEMGRPQFAWPNPNGSPDIGSAWVNTNSYVSRWNHAFNTLEPPIFNQYQIMKSESVYLPPTVTTPADAAKFWVTRLLRDKATTQTLNAAITYAQRPDVLGDGDSFSNSGKKMLGLWRLASAIGCSLEFQRR